MSKELELIRLLIKGANEYEKETGNKNPTVYLSRNNLLIIEKALKRLESIDNSNPSEALECFGNMQNRIASNISTIEYTTIKQALLKAQEPKHYLKWEDLEFEEARCQYSNVKLGNANFQMTCYLYKGCMKKVWIRNEIISFELKDTEEDKQFFNDLHLERMEE